MTCKKPFELDHLEHHEQQCNMYVPVLFSKQINEVLETPRDEPLSVHEERLATHLVKRKLNTSSSKSLVVLHTGGTVSSRNMFIIFHCYSGENNRDDISSKIEKISY